MIASKTICSEWYPAHRLIITQISGDMEIDDVIQWEQTLQIALSKVEDSGTFKIFVNLNGFNAANLDAHKYFRNIIPLTLAEYGWKVGYTAMFPEEAGQIVIRKKRNVQCVAAVHCHHDATKIEKYQALYSSSNEQFFTDEKVCQHWIGHWQPQ
ncbi:hypothetical protein [Dyadobacter sp. CY343]|uniref:hypothetical protein n=1 Tax=Dyadobacter sp. CY343 TaxID=2907299 RepID=UPI001F427510|nr:hypothetical protein [Dyadobacter sp. CY343]MCE7060235.1 hypothetical protein [Dyadobacter sp. CY343]